jgi:hypothetical protein
MTLHSAARGLQPVVCYISRDIVFSIIIHLANLAPTDNVVHQEPGASAHQPHQASSGTYRPPKNQPNSQMIVNACTFVICAASGLPGWTVRTSPVLDGKQIHSDSNEGMFLVIFNHHFTIPHIFPSLASLCIIMISQVQLEFQYVAENIAPPVPLTPPHVTEHAQGTWSTPPCPLIQDGHKVFNQFIGTGARLDNLHIQIACSKFSLPWVISKLCQSFHVFCIANSKRTLRADIPSFDLGIAFSPQQKSYQTPVPHTSQALLSRVPSPNSCHQTSEERLSSNNAKLSPKTTTLNHANTILYDQMALLDEASSQQDEVLYGQLVRGTYEKGHVPNHHIDTSVSISSQRHPRPAPENVQMFSLVLQNDNTVDHNRYTLNPV